MIIRRVLFLVTKNFKDDAVEVAAAEGERGVPLSGPGDRMRLGRVIWDLVDLMSAFPIDAAGAGFARKTSVSNSPALQRNVQFVSYGFAAAWIVLVVYVLMMVGRESRLKREIA